MDLYIDDDSQGLHLENWLSILESRGVTRFLHKALAPNDNGKNQPYLGSAVELLQLLPVRNPEHKISYSRRYGKETIKERVFHELPFYWVDASGNSHFAPNTKIILYPQYPEMRLSGFVQGASAAPHSLMSPKSRGREEGRHLILGLASGKVFGFMFSEHSRSARGISQIAKGEQYGALVEIFPGKTKDADSKSELLSKLEETKSKGWIESCRLNKNGELIPYSAGNGAGYTLEAMLGITPNSEAGPDFLDWEVKTHVAGSSSPMTLMTPEPDFGFYVDPGFIQFMLRFGYPDRKTVDRLNFSKAHRVGKKNSNSELELHLTPWKEGRKDGLSLEGSTNLVDTSSPELLIAAGWSYLKLYKHWLNKHAFAVYVEMERKKEGSVTSYRVGEKISLGSGTSFFRLLSAFEAGAIVHDPGLKLENASSTSPKGKKRNQFRVKRSDLKLLYRDFDTEFLK